MLRNTLTSQIPRSRGRRTRSFLKVGSACWRRDFPSSSLLCAIWFPSLFAILYSLFCPLWSPGSLLVLNRFCSLNSAAEHFRELYLRAGCKLGLELHAVAGRLCVTLVKILLTHHVTSKNVWYRPHYLPREANYSSSSYFFHSSMFCQSTWLAQL